MTGRQHGALPCAIGAGNSINNKYMEVIKFIYEHWFITIVFLLLIAESFPIVIIKK